MKDKALTTFKSLRPGQKRIVVFMGIGVALMLIGVMAYFTNSGPNKEVAEQVRNTKSTAVSMDDELLKKNQLLEAQKEATLAKQALDDALKAKEEEGKLNDEAARNAGLNPPVGKGSFGPPPPLPRQMAGGTQKRGGSVPLPPPPMPGGGGLSNLPPPPPMNAGGAPTGGPAASQTPTIESEIGGIAMVENSKASSKSSADKDDKKKEESRSVLLPISYMEATLLSGLDAPTSGDAKGNPVPVLIRVKTPAVLPNDVKANLRGCFVVADGKGNLGTERAELVLVSLSCIDRKGQAVIDQSLTGYVVDADGKAGLRGRVVTKMGSMIVRSAIAGMFGGVGDALNDASTTTSFSALGNVSQIKPDEVALAGVGTGISNAFKEIQKFYMELARQTMPVIEIGAARPVTLVLTKSTQLNIKKIRGGKNN